MRITVSKDVLLHALSILASTVSQRAESAYLVSTYMRANGEALRLETTNLESSARLDIASICEEDGEALIPTKVLLGIVKTLPDAAVSIEADKRAAAIVCGASELRIPAFDPLDFPRFPDLEPSQTFSIAFPEFRRLVRKASSAAHPPDKDAVYSGLLFEVEGDMFRVVGTDAHRVSFDEVEVAGCDPFRVVIPAAFLRDITSLPEDGGDIALGITDNQVIVEYGSASLVSRILNGRFTDVTRFVPSTFDGEAVLPVAALSGAIKRAESISNLGAPELFLEFDIDAGTLTLTRDARAEGSFREVIECESMKGALKKTRLSCCYLDVALQTIPGDSVAIHPQSGRDPLFLKWPDSGNSFYCIAPLYAAGE